MGRNLTVGGHAVVDEAGKTVPFHLVSSERISLHAVISIAYDDVRHTFSVSISQGTYDIEVLLDDRFYLLDGIFCHGFLLAGIWCLDSGRLRLLLIAQMKSDPDCDESAANERYDSNIYLLSFHVSKSTHFLSDNP